MKTRDEIEADDAAMRIVRHLDQAGVRGPDHDPSRYSLARQILSFLAVTDEPPTRILEADLQPRMPPGAPYGAAWELAIACIAARTDAAHVRASFEIAELQHRLQKAGRVTE